MTSRRTSSRSMRSPTPPPSRSSWTRWWRLNKAGKIKEIADMRDETDLNGLKLAIDLKRGVDPDKLMQKLSTSSPPPGQLRLQLQHPDRRHAPGHGGRGDSGRVDRLAHGIRPPPGLLRHEEEGGGKAPPAPGPARRFCWTSTRPSRSSGGDGGRRGVVPQPDDRLRHRPGQAEYVAEIRLRNINKEYILKRTAEVDELSGQIAELKELVNTPAAPAGHHPGAHRSEKEIRRPPAHRNPLRRGGRGRDHRGRGARHPCQPVPLPGGLSQEDHPAVPAHVLEQKYKEGGRPLPQWDASNRDELLVFTDRQQCYKTRLSDFDPTKASALGITCPPSWAWTRGRRWSGPASPETTPPMCSSALKTARWPGSPCPPIRPRATAA